MSSSRPTEAYAGLRDFRERGGTAADNPDGWGLSYRENGIFRLVKEPVAAAQSQEFVRLMESVHSDLILGHVRKARYPPINTMANTHPFKHVCCGKEWVFAHNGLIPGIVAIEQGNNEAVCRPIGQTDSEYAFCHLLSHVAHRLQTESQIPESWFQSMATVAETVASYGQFNFLMTDGEYLIAYAHDRLHYVECHHQDSTMATILDIIIIATEPLPTYGPWHTFEPGELRIYRHGRLVGDVKTQPLPPPIRNQDVKSDTMPKA